MFNVKADVKLVETGVKLIKKMDEANKKAVKRSGPLVRGFIRRTIRSSRSKTGRKIPSQPGRPPKSHVGRDFGLKWVRYHFDERSRTTRVGPLMSNGKDVPGILEHGGRTSIRLRDGRIVSKSIAPRPYTSVALEQFKEKYPDLWRNILQ